MLKVMLVDDEVLVRLGVKSLIDWEKHGFQYIGDAPDGNEAWNMIERNPPDILLTDIVMPNMNGLELIEKVKNAFPYVRIIVLSSHNEYSYLRQAMKMGVDDYILKTSLKPQELLELLLETANKIAKSNKEIQERITRGEETGDDQRAKFAEWIWQLIDNRQTDAALFPEAFSGNNYLMLMQIHRNETVLSAENQGIRKTLHNLIELELKKWTNGYVVPYKEFEILLLVSFESEKDHGLPRLSDIGKDLIIAAKRFLNISATIGISHPFSQPEEIGKAYLEAKSALQLYFFDGKENVYAYPIDSVNRQTGQLFTKEDEQKVIAAVERIDEDGIKQVTHAIFDKISNCKGPLDKNIEVCLQLLHCFQTGFKPFVGEELISDLEAEGPLYKQILCFEELSEARQWFDRLIETFCARARAAISESYREDIHRLILNMKSDFAANWSLKTAAAMVNMNESYLSYLFKKETKTSFTEYLTKLRLEKATELLINTNLPIYLIAEQVGYDNVNYFGRVFKKVKGVSPHHFRERFQKK